MVFGLSNNASRRALIFIAFVLCIALGYSSVRNALAAHNAGLGSRRGYERAVHLEPDNAENWFLLGRYWQYNLEEPDSQLALTAYLTSLALNPRAADTWLDLATAYESTGDLSAARASFLQAQRVYPQSAEVSWRYGNFLLRQNELPSAFAEIRRAISLDPKRAAEAFSRCWRVDQDIQAILNNVLPPSAPVYLDAIRELDSDAAIDPALVVWDRLLSLHPKLPLHDVLPFSDSLIQAHRIADARRVWEQAATLSPTSPPNDLPDSAIWDGGFETGVTGGGFSWTFAPPSPGVQVSVDVNEKHSGQHSLRLGFDGLRNVNFEGVCHLAEVRPATHYEFSAWIRTQTLTTTQGVRFRLDWMENSHPASAETTDAHGTLPWTQITLPWSASAAVQQLRVCVIRHPSDDFGSRIHGTAWIDDVALVPESREFRSSPASRKP